MRAAAILTLLLAFVAAVILPNDVGTHNLPATGSKHVVVKAGHHVVKPARGGFAASLVANQRLCQSSLVGDCPAVIYRSGRTVANGQLSLPLLI